MLLRDLDEKIRDKNALLAVIGLGYVGLAVACTFAEAGFNVLGIDILPDRVQRINSGISPIDGEEPGLVELLAGVVASGKLRATMDYAQLAVCDVVLIAVDTPVDANHIPHYEALKAALTSLCPVMKRGALVIVESTLAPGTMDQLVLPLLSEARGKTLNDDFFLGNCPERVMPGKLLANIRSLNRVVGGMTPETAEVMAGLYGHIVSADLDLTTCVIAELVKTAENAYRDVQIAFANEVALICEAVGGDVWKVRDLVNKSPYRDMHLPGAGVGGHCIPKDPWLLAYSVIDKDVSLKLIPASRAVNDGMPAHMAELVEQALDAAGRRLADSTILIMGYSYLENSDDTRNSPSIWLIERLRSLGASIRIQDPYVLPFQQDWRQLAQGCDAVVMMVKHGLYVNIDLNELAPLLRTPLLVDGRRVFNRDQAKAAGLSYWAVGEKRGSIESRIGRRNTSPCIE
jgi:UDP-N-acetyl-D-mannosaminuronic acid dehydrogenase